VVQLSKLSRKQRESILSAISFGFFLILAGAIFFATPHLFDDILAFFRDFDAIPVPNFGFPLPGPVTPEAHLTVYTAAGQFCLAWSFFQIGMLALRIVARSSTSKMAETASNIIYWFGSYYLVQRSLVETTRWFEYWALIIALLGMSLIARGIFVAVAYTYRRRFYGNP
jgi:hypothetical protein